MKNMIYTYLFFSLIISNEVFASAPPAYEMKIEKGNIDCKRELNQALGITNQDAPLYFIVVTRADDEPPLLEPQAWNDVLNALEDICGDNDEINHLNSSPSRTGDLLNYVQTHKPELMNSCKMVVFSEYFCKRKPLTNDEYNKFINGGGDYLGLKPVSSKCARTVFYPHFLYSEPYSNTNHTVVLKKYNGIATQVLECINTSLQTDTITEGVIGFLTTLAYALEAPKSQVFSKEAICELASTLKLDPFHGHNAAQLAGRLREVLAAPEDKDKAVIGVLMDPANVETLLTTLKKFPASSPLSPCTQAVELSFNLKNKLLGSIDGGVGGTMFLFPKFWDIRCAAYKQVGMNFLSVVVPMRGEFVRNIVRNVVQSICRGNILTEYKKKTFWDEDDAIGISSLGESALVLNDSIYDFGTGLDRAFPDDIQKVPQTSRGRQELLNIQNALLRNIAVEICADLRNGVRQNNRWSNIDKQSGFLLLQSNTIDPINGVPNNVSHLPRSSAEHDFYIIQADGGSYDKPPAGSHIFKIDASGSPILCKAETTQEDRPVSFDFKNGIKITLYKL